MSPLQWALLILGAVAIVALYLFSRRDRRAMEKFDPAAGAEPILPAPSEKQLDIFNSQNQQFDEFGVGKPRRIPPTFGEFEEGFEPDPADDTPSVGTPSASAPRASEPSATAPTLKPAAPAPKEKIIALLIAEREGAHISGPALHQALQRQRLEYGARQIYHRLYKGVVVFSVASLLKPGILDPEQAAQLSTPGLTLFMMLPGPQRPADALRDMLGTAESLAKTLNAEVYDGKRAPFNAQAARALTAEIDAWARANGA
ncbi:MAG: hypothetical protein JWR16_3112 [Nevskia sp.]|nr:hypothetical protein [Nevskia sp.]